MAFLCEVTICSLIVSVNGPKNCKCLCGAAVATSSSLLAQPSARPCGRGTFSQKFHFNGGVRGWHSVAAASAPRPHRQFSASVKCRREMIDLKNLFDASKRKRPKRKTFLDEFLGQSNFSLYS